jgi:hypothetical protein
MMLFASILLLAASTGREYVDEVHQIPAGDWKFKEIRLHQQPARISASYEVLNGTGSVRAALMLREDLERMSGDLPGSIAMTAEGNRGHFVDVVRRKGDYVVVLDNQDGKQAATVRLLVWLDFGPDTGPEVKQLTPRRQLMVVAISFAVFFGIVGYSGRRLLKAMRP